jgi:hypothetical protein
MTLIHKVRVSLPTCPHSLHVIYALQRTRPARSGCNPRVPWAGSPILFSLDEEGYPMDSKITPAQVSPGVLYLGRNRRPFVLHHYPRCLDRGVREHARSSGTVKQFS